MDKYNLSMLCDFYELTMSNGYFKNGFYKKQVYFDVFFRKVPDNGGFAIAAGLEQVIDYINNLHFDENDIKYLESKGIFDRQFLDYLANFKFSGDIYAVPEGTPVFPNEPIMVVKAPAIEAQMIETFLLLTLNHQSLIATKANRIVRSAQGRTVVVAFLAIVIGIGVIVLISSFNNSEDSKSESGKIQPVDTEAFYEENSEVISVIDAKDSKSVSTEQEVAKAFTDRGFTQFPVTTSFYKKD